MSFKKIRNSFSVLLNDVPSLPARDFHEAILKAVTVNRARIASLFGANTVDGGVELFAVLANDSYGNLSLCRTQAHSLSSLTPFIAEAHLFEREIAEQYSVEVPDHPWLKAVRSYREDGPATIDFFSVNGEEVHEVAVGPVHAGVIEPGHFRFQCHGEKVFHLEIALGYQHRGIENAIIGGPHRRTMHQMETVAGDTTIGHALAYAQAIEGLSGTAVPARAQSIRGVALELERLANHVGDLGALANDVAYLPTASYCGRLRGEFLNMTAEICGSRFGRGLIRPGGVGFDLHTQQVTLLQQRLRTTFEEVKQAVEMLWDTPTVVERFDSTGRVSIEDAEAIGLVGPAARACGLVRDVRHDHPSGIFRFVHVPVITAHEGDVNSRAFVRWREIQQSTQFILQQLETLPQTNIKNGLLPLKPESIAVSLVEGWRGEICHVAITDANGSFRKYKITDPSFHNWFGLALALRNGQISDFPLCNKSFNLSYCGHDL